MGKIFSRIKGTGEANSVPEQEKEKSNAKTQESPIASSSSPSTSPPVETAVAAEEIVNNNGAGSSVNAVPSVENEEPASSSPHVDEPIEEVLQPSTVESDQLSPSSKSPAESDASTANHHESFIKEDENEIAVASTTSSSHDVVENVSEQVEEVTPTETSATADALDIHHKEVPPTVNENNDEKRETNVPHTKEAGVENHEPNKEAHKVEDTLKSEEPEKKETKEEESKPIEKAEETLTNEPEKTLQEKELASGEISVTHKNEAEKVEHQTEKASQEEAIPVDQESLPIDSEVNHISNETTAPTENASIHTHDQSKPTEATSEDQSGAQVHAESTTETSSTIAGDVSSV
jgi:hypothetical protein